FFFAGLWFPGGGGSFSTVIAGFVFASECVRWLACLRLRVKFIGLGVVLNHLGTVLDGALRWNSLVIEDGYGVLIRCVPAKLVAVLHLLRLTLTFRVPMW
ncbi:hypothetical protein HID58_077846, partial [Brassica napus]